MHPFKNKRGLTLVEVMVTIAIGLAISLALVLLLSVISSTAAVINGQAYLQSQMAIAMQTFNQDARLTAGIFPTQDLDSEGDGTAQVDLVLPSIDASGHILTGSNDTISYNFTSVSGVLTRTVSPAAGSSRAAALQVLARELTRVEFVPSWTTAPETNGIRLNLTGQRVESGRALSFSLSSSAASRLR